MHSSIEKLLSFLEDPECAKYLSLAIQSCLSEFCAEHDIEDVGALSGFIGEEVFEQLYPCILEFFFSNSYTKRTKTGPVVWNVVDLFLKRKGLLLNAEEKEYLSSLRRSHLGLYEVTGVERDKALILRDLIEDRPPVRALEKSLTRQVKQWDVLALRLVKTDNKYVLAGGALPFDRAIAKNAAKGIRALHEATGTMVSMNAANDPDMQMYSEDERQRLIRVMWATEIITIYLNRVYENLNEKRLLTNTDGDSLVFCTLEFPLGDNWLETAAAMSKTGEFMPDQGHSDKKHIAWNWIATRAHRGKKSALLPDEQSTEQKTYACDAQIIDSDIGRPVLVLGTLDLYPDRLLAEVNSVARADKLAAKLKRLLGKKLGKPVRRERMPDDVGGREGMGPADIKPDTMTLEEKSTAIHAFMWDHYTQWLDTALPAFKGKSPRQMVKTRDGREQIIDLLKEIEGGQQRAEENTGIVPFDFQWLWKELGLKREAA